jgi:hypothetical protein
VVGSSECSSESSGSVKDDEVLSRLAGQEVSWAMNLVWGYSCF